MQGENNKEKEDKDKPKEEKKPAKITIIPSGNRITIITDDPELQRKVQQLAEIITRKGEGEDFKFIKLKNANAVDVARILDEMYPAATCALRHDNPWELLVATILSAQCTDKRVNEVTPGLFAKYPTRQK